MNEKDFLEWCKQEVCDYTNKHLDKTDNKEMWHSKGDRAISPLPKKLIGE